MIDDIIDAVVTAFAGEAVDSAIRKRRERKAREAGRVRGAVRALNGEAHGISSRWEVIEFEPGPQVLIWGRVRLDVASVHRRTERTKLSEQPPLGSDAVILVLSTPTGVVECAVPREDAQPVAARLGFPVDS
ncbi:hypothetical protein [Gryllotalpicola ginsengisoli]|uniref:hypothetical protein n=1 Tax=Gryllotalpicola ginsengisoli TaxID=444608 RepID=UPI0003B3632E|nr:hypothetical protein [Gryllotalpicola ginsengisoli]